jgi:hypothetical protein
MTAGVSSYRSGLPFPEGSHDDLLDAVEIGLRELDVGATFDIEAGDIYRR